MPERQGEADTGPSAILRLGDPRLRARAAPVDDLDHPDCAAAAGRLQATLDAFRAARGFGRAIAAPQIGVGLRLVAFHLAGERFAMINPELTARSADTFTLWDDCFCFPDLLVKVRRHRSVSVRWLDQRGAAQRWDGVDAAAAELLQHEIDHLDGVLAVDRAVDRDSLVDRAVFEVRRDWFAALVDAAPRRPAPS